MDQPGSGYSVRLSVGHDVQPQFIQQETHCIVIKATEKEKLRDLLKIDRGNDAVIQMRSTRSAPGSACR